MKNPVLAPIAVEVITNTVSIGIYAIDNNRDKILANYITDNTHFKPREYNIYYNAQGVPYFNFYGRRHYIDNFMRV